MIGLIRSVYKISDICCVYGSQDEWQWIHLLHFGLKDSSVVQEQIIFQLM